MIDSCLIGGLTEPPWQQDRYIATAEDLGFLIYNSFFEIYAAHCFCAVCKDGIAEDTAQGLAELKVLIVRCTCGNCRVHFARLLTTHMNDSDHRKATVVSSQTPQTATDTTLAKGARWYRDVRPMASTTECAQRSMQQLNFH
jgi:hypothetical protein